MGGRWVAGRCGAAPAILTRAPGARRRTARTPTCHPGAIGSGSIALVCARTQARAVRDSFGPGAIRPAVETRGFPGGGDRADSPAFTPPETECHNLYSSV